MVNGVGDAVGPPVEEGLEVSRREPVADGLEAVGSVGGGKPVGQLGEGNPGPAGLALGPLVAVEPNLGGIGEVGADLDEAGSELTVQDVEVVAADPALGLVPVEPHRVALGLLGGAEHPLELLGGDDRDNTVAACGLRSFKIGTHVIELAVVPAGPVRLGEMQHRDAARLGEGIHVSAEPVTDPFDHRR